MGQCFYRAFIGKLTVSQVRCFCCYCWTYKIARCKRATSIGCVQSLYFLGKLPFERKEKKDFIILLYTNDQCHWGLLFLWNLKKRCLLSIVGSSLGFVGSCCALHASVTFLAPTYAYAAVLLNGGRDPKIVLPTRMLVDPCKSALWKSSLIPYFPEKVNIKPFFGRVSRPHFFQRQLGGSLPVPLPFVPCTSVLPSFLCGAFILTMLSSRSLILRASWMVVLQSFNA